MMDWLEKILFYNIPGYEREDAKKLASAIREEIRKRRPTELNDDVYMEAIHNYDKAIGIKEE